VKPSCPRLFEVEAARDGRLTGLDLARFQTHVSHCALCAQEAEVLDAFAKSLRSLPAVPNDDLRVRRERTRLLAAFDTALVPAPSNIKRWLIPLVAAAVLTALTLTLWHSGPAPKRSATVETAAAARPREAIAVRASPASQWSRQIENHRETITLTAGTITVSIDHTLSPRRLRVILPDGELEDLGTTFSVTATPTATTHVAVQDGTVILRLRERAPIILGANQAYSPNISQPTTEAAPPSPPRAPAPAAPAASNRAASSVPAPAPSSAMGDAASEFRTALSALNTGNNALAANLFGSFLASHPTAPNAEDAAYLRILALQRAGSMQAMRAAARNYLDRYPSAFRRAEVEPLAR
jgi:hypothetical protein